MTRSAPESRLAELRREVERERPVAPRRPTMKPAPQKGAGINWHKLAFGAAKVVVLDHPDVSHLKVRPLLDVQVLRDGHPPPTPQRQPPLGHARITLSAGNTIESAEAGKVARTDWPLASLVMQIATFDAAAGVGIVVVHLRSSICSWSDAPT